MQGTAELEAARTALQRHAWREAFELFAGIDQDLTAEDLEGFAEAAWWTARLDTCIESRERAFELYRRNGNAQGAALTAIALTKDHFARREASIAMAWFRRAEKLLEGDETSIAVGHLERTRSVMALEGDADYQTAFERAEAALAIAGKVGDRDLLAISLHDKGRALVGLGRVDEGSALMDEANLAAVAGELSPLWTAAVFCNTITMCEEIADYSRAGDWTEAAKRWCERQAIAGFPGMCRVYRSKILRVRGRWSEALIEAQKAADETATFNLSYAAAAFNQLGEVRLEMGDLQAAEDAFAKASELGLDPQPGLALLRLRQDKPEAAWMGLRRALDDRDSDIHRAHLLLAAVEIALVIGDEDAARTFVEELQSTAEIYRTLALRSAAATAAGRLHLALGDIPRAISVLRLAVQLWRETDLPYEMAVARELLGRALHDGGDEDAAKLEMAAAGSVRDRLASDAGASAPPEAATVAPSIPPAIESTTTPRFKHEGEYWSIKYSGEPFLLRDSKGLHHLARLLARPGYEFHALDLAGPGAERISSAAVAVDPDLTVAGDDAGPMLDPQAKASYKARLDELREELEEAEAWADEGRITKARGEIEFLASELAAAVGLGGRDRKAASTAEKARVNVTRSIRSAIDRIAEQNAALGDHLAATVKTGTFCTYLTDPRNPITWET